MGIEEKNHQGWELEIKNKIIKKRRKKFFAFFIEKINRTIFSYIRKGASPAGMDSLRYNYYAINNKLKHVDNVTSGANYTVDIDDQPDGN